MPFERLETLERIAESGLVAVVRAGDVLAPDAAGRLQAGDSLILAGDSRAYSDFLRAHGGDAGLGTD